MKEMSDQTRMMFSSCWSSRSRSSGRIFTSRPAPPPSKNQRQTPYKRRRRSRGVARSAAGIGVRSSAAQAAPARADSGDSGVRGKIDRRRKSALPRANLQSRRRGAQLEVEEISRRSEAASSAGAGRSRMRRSNWAGRFPCACRCATQERRRTRRLYEVTPREARDTSTAPADYHIPLERRPSGRHQEADVRSRTTNCRSKFPRSLDGKPLAPRASPGVADSATGRFTRPRSS